MHLPDRITIREVSPRDGLQAEAELFSTDSKVRLIGLLADAGFRRINATSFASPKAVPQMADAADVALAVQRWSGIRFDATVPNERGVERAVKAGMSAVCVFVSASDLGSRANVGRPTNESMSAAIRAIQIATAAGVESVGTVSKAFGSPFGDAVEEDRVIALLGQFVAAGVTGIALGDTSGEANPRQVERTVGRVLDAFPDVELGLHFHDTRGLALANALAAMQAGASHLDSAVGGIGGSPFTKNSAGNLATEDLVFMCEAMGVETGVSLERVLDAYDYVRALLGRDLPGRTGKLPRGERPGAAK